MSEKEKKEGAQDLKDFFFPFTDECPELKGKYVVISTDTVESAIPYAKTMFDRFAKEPVESTEGLEFVSVADAMTTLNVYFANMMIGQKAKIVFENLSGEGRIELEAEFKEDYQLEIVAKEQPEEGAQGLYIDLNNKFFNMLSAGDA